MSLSVDIDLSASCIPLNQSVSLCVTFPGGATLCAQDGLGTGDASAIVKSMLGQLNTALVPLVPFFTALEFVKAVFDCIDAIPDCIGPPPDPTKLLQAIPALANAVAKLLKMIPPITIFVLVKGILDVIITGIVGLKAKLTAMLRANLRVAAAATRAADTGNLQLLAVVDCAAGNLAVQLANINLEFEPLNRMIGIINALLEIAGLECIPALSGVASVSPEALDALDVVVEFLVTVRDAIPTEIPPLPGITPGQC